MPLTFAACGDDGKMLGSDGNAGSSNAGSAGNGSSAGSGHAGTQNSAGTSSGGSASGGSASSGGAIAGAGADDGGTTSGGTASCSTGQCVRANVCLDHCGGNVVYTGCCPCAANTIEQLSCDNAGGQGGGGQGSTDCVGTTCTASQTCVAYRTVGGAVEPPGQNNTCTTGRHLEGSYCQPDFAYTCAGLTGCTAPSNTCRCAPTTACANTTVCKLPTASTWLDTSADLVCELLAP